MQEVKGSVCSGDLYSISQVLNIKFILNKVYKVREVPHGKGDCLQFVHNPKHRLQGLVDCRPFFQEGEWVKNWRVRAHKVIHTVKRGKITCHLPESLS